jgi:6-phosphogluconate dehydrogenase
MLIVIMGVSGCGKTTVGKKLADRLGWSFYDGDDFHPPANIAKMSAGIPLNDEDRSEWLKALAGLIESGQNGVMACSALKQAYREQLCQQSSEVYFVYLKGSFDLIFERLSLRRDHYMKPEMLKSQFAALEEPVGSLTLPISLPVDDLVATIAARLVEGNFSLGIVGLGVMGRSLAYNFIRSGYVPLGYDPNPKLLPGMNIPQAKSLAELVERLPVPRTLFLMVPAGPIVDQTIESIRPHLAPGDLIVDGGNSYFLDTERRAAELDHAGFSYIGMGVSGGESGALWGPSMMAGGSLTAWERVKDLFQDISAKTETGESCVGWMGSGGAGHYVKMVHNGIEYGDMQLIAEIYDLLHRGAGISNQNLAEIFAEWNQGVLRSYLIEITAAILSKMDEESGRSLVDVIVDEAAQKGTGKWTSQNAFELGVAIPTITAAVECRYLSGLKKERGIASDLLGSRPAFAGDHRALVKAAEKSLYTSKIISYAQGLALIKSAAKTYQWDIQLAGVARVWRAGCIIRADLLSDISQAFDDDPDLANLLLDERFKRIVLDNQSAWRESICTAIQLGIPMPAACSALTYFDSYCSAVLPANLTQAQRDFFGAHTYRRVDREGSFHTHWVE